MGQASSTVAGSLLEEGCSDQLCTARNNAGNMSLVPAQSSRGGDSRGQKAFESVIVADLVYKQPELHVEDQAAVRIVVAEEGVEPIRASAPSEGRERGARNGPEAHADSTVAEAQQGQVHNARSQRHVHVVECF
jgi:hypothetical protein